MKQRFILLLLAAAMVGASACGETGTVSDTTAPEPAGTDAEPVQPLLPEKDFGGKAFRFATYEANLPFFWTDEENGDLINDAVYQAVSQTEEQYHFSYEPTIYGTANSDVERYVTSTVLAGEDACEVVSGHDGVMWQLSLKGCFADMRAEELHRFDQPWWMTYANEELMVNGRQHVFSTYMSYKSLSLAQCLYLNTALAADNGIKIPYDDVYAGTWMLDDFLGMVRDFYQDVKIDAINEYFK